MDKQGQVETEPGQSSDIKQQVQQVRELFADAPELAKTALENVLREIESGVTRTQYPAIVGNTGNHEPFAYAGFANPCNAQQPLTAHS
jgi:hypothetical protein